MSYVIYVHESHPDSTKDRLFKYPLDSGKKFDYRARISSSCFFFGRRSRNVKGGRNSKGFAKPGTTIYSFHHEGDPFASGLVKSGVLITEVADIWEFYVAIGYDYKKKKYL